jgi:hypothetical protein
MVQVPEKLVIEFRAMYCFTFLAPPESCVLYVRWCQCKKYFKLTLILERDLFVDFERIQTRSLRESSS